VRDITETMRRLKLEEQVRKLTESLPIGLFQFCRDKDGVFSVPFLSEGASRISGIPVCEQRATPDVFSELVLAEDVERYRWSFEASGRSGAAWDCEFRIRTRNGAEKWVCINAEIERSADRTDWYGYIADISARKRQEMEIETLAFFDPLTGLPNRRRFMDRMQRLATAARGGAMQAALLYIDLDNFKGLNDSQGHDVGDRLLVQVAERLRRCVSERDMVARMGGDEFVVLLEDLPGDTAPATRAAIATAHRALAELSREFVLDDLRHVGSASIGAVVLEAPGLTADEALKRADIAMYQAKSAGRNGVALFDPARLSRESDRFELLGDLRTAIAAGDLTLHFQPQVDFEGRVIGAEALLRWPGAPRAISPARIVALADQHGLGEVLTRSIIDGALASLAGWAHRPETAHLRLSLNVTAQSFVADGFPVMVRDLLDRHRVDPGRITLELTEHVMAQDCDRILRRMNEIKAMRIRLSLDDFGTGYSSLARLKRLPFDEIKIDGSFVADIESSDGDRALVKTILSMASTLGLKSVAEHVENVRQEAFLRAFGCDVLQGNFYSRPLPRDEFECLFGPSARISNHPPHRLGA
jgi:diguanylate cyclase (GGDEF)-like protein